VIRATDCHVVAAPSGEQTEVCHGPSNRGGERQQIPTGSSIDTACAVSIDFSVNLTRPIFD
jgi:hypothetical protein